MQHDISYFHNTYTVNLWKKDYIKKVYKNIVAETEYAAVVDVASRLGCTVDKILKRDKQDIYDLPDNLTLYVYDNNDM